MKKKDVDREIKDFLYLKNDKDFQRRTRVAHLLLETRKVAVLREIASSLSDINQHFQETG